MTESLNLTAPPNEHIQRTVEKIIFKPEECKAFTWAPYQCIFSDDQKAVKVAKNCLRINKYLHRFKGYLQYAREKEKICVDNRILTDQETLDLLQVGYEIEDRERAIHRFIPELSNRLTQKAYMR